MSLRLSQNQFLQREYERIRFPDYQRMLVEIAQTPCVDFAEIENRKREQQFLRALDDEGKATAVIIDFDVVTLEQLQLIQEHARRLGSQCLIHSTSQSTTASPRIRLIFPINPGDVDINATIQELAFPVECDPNAKGQYRGWYLPSIHAEPIWFELVPGPKLAPRYREGIPAAGARPLIEQEHVDTDDDDGENEHLVQAGRASAPLMTWLKIQISNDVEEFAATADTWLREWLVGKEYELRGNQTNAGAGHIGYELVCPDCGTPSAKVILDIASGATHACCRRTNCSFEKKTKPTPDDPYHVVNPLFIIRKLALRFTVQKLGNVWSRWWVQGDLYFKENTVLGCICALTGLSMDVLRKAASTIQCSTIMAANSLPPVDQKMIQSCIAFLEDDHVHKSLSGQVPLTNLKCLASSAPDTIAKLTEGLTPMHWQYLDLLQWKTPSIEINNHQVKLQPGKGLQQPIGTKQVLSLGYKLWTQRTLTNRLCTLSPIVFINPKQMFTDGEQHPRTSMLRQRTMLALARGCKVYLIFPCHHDQMQRYMSMLGIPRAQSTSRRKLLNET